MCPSAQVAAKAAGEHRAVLAGLPVLQKLRAALPATAAKVGARVRLGQRFSALEIMVAQVITNLGFCNVKHVPAENGE